MGLIAAPAVCPDVKGRAGIPWLSSALMDIATLIGILACVGLIALSILTKSSLTTFVDAPSLLLVFGGSIAATLLCFPLGVVLRAFKVVRKVLFATPQNPVDHVVTLVRLAEVARRDGILSLENHLNDGAFDDFMVRGLRMAIDGQDPAVIQMAMEQEIDTLMERHAVGKGLFETLGKYAPAFGMLGTIMGLIMMLKNMDDPAALGPGMALALITTFYGSLFANVFFLPIADKLGARSTEEVSTKILIIRGVMSIQSGDNPRIVQQKLLAFLDARQRSSVEDTAG
jgi:chemotaxis protein MotA